MMNGKIRAKMTQLSRERSDKKRIALMREAGNRIQVREFDNMLCLSLDGIPVLPMRDFDKQTLADARLTFFNYLMEKRG